MAQFNVKGAFDGRFIPLPRGTSMRRDRGSLLAAKTPAPAAKSQSAQTSVAEKEDQDLDERNQRRDQASDVKRHAKEAKHHIGAKSGKEDDDDE
ncbi:hypothetical protein [Sphingobium herbicidovorans]|nr:hypothetical protein K663_04360 [Sphingobium sp. MI1205]